MHSWCLGRNAETSRDLREKNGWLIIATSWPGEEGDGVHHVNMYKHDFQRRREAVLGG